MLEKARVTAEHVRQMKTKFNLPNRVIMKVAGISQKTLWKILKHNFDPLSVLAAWQIKKIQPRPNFEPTKCF